MRVLGKAMGLAAGFLLGEGSPWWVGIGFILGHFVDRTRAKHEGASAKGDRWSQVVLVPGRPSAHYNVNLTTTYCRVLFYSIGRIAKMDGRVSEREIGWVEQLMGRMEIKGALRDQCIGFFSQGKSLTDDFNNEISGLYWQINAHDVLKRQFVEVLVGATYMDGVCNRDGWLLVLEIAKKLKYPDASLWQLRHQYEDKLQRAKDPNKHHRESPEYAAYQRAYEQPNNNKSRFDQSLKSGKITFDKALQVLGLTQTEFSNLQEKELKRVYRKLMSQHHPDKLAASNATEQEIERAKEMTQQIRAAYEALGKAMASRR